jgi:hypothetical protein
LTSASLGPAAGRLIARPRLCSANGRHASRREAKTFAVSPSAEASTFARMGLRAAGVAVSALDLAGRERPCCYLLRPPLSDGLLRMGDEERVELSLKTPWRDGAVSIVLTPEELVARLARPSG